MLLKCNVDRLDQIFSCTKNLKGAETKNLKGVEYIHLNWHSFISVPVVWSNTCSIRWEYIWAHTLQFLYYQFFSHTPVSFASLISCLQVCILLCLKYRVTNKNNMKHSAKCLLFIYHDLYYRVSIQPYMLCSREKNHEF